MIATLRRADRRSPLNVLLFSGSSLPRLAFLGVPRRVSTGFVLFRVALGATIDAAKALRDGGGMPAAPSYAEVNGLAG